MDPSWIRLKVTVCFLYCFLQSCTQESHLIKSPTNRLSRTPMVHPSSQAQCEAPRGLGTETEGVLAGVGDIQEAVLILLSDQSLELQYAAFLIWVLRTLCSS